MRRRQVILGVVFVLWGGAIAVKMLITGIPDPTASSYSAGGFAAFVFSFVMIAVGARALVKHLGRKDDFDDAMRSAGRRPWLIVALVLGVAIALVAGGFGLWQHLRVDRANALAVKYGVAASKDDVSLADRCTGVMREEYNTTDDPGTAGVPPQAYALLAPKVCALGVERGLVESDGTMTEEAGYELTTDVMERMGVARVQTLVFNELAVAQYHLAKPGEVTRWHRCVAMGYSGWDAQPSKESLPPRELFQRVVRDACTSGIERGLVPASGAPEPGSPEFAAFQQLLMDALLERAPA